MKGFKTKKGRCIVTDEEIRLESPFLARFKRTYEGSKLLFAGVVLVIGYLVVSLIFDQFIFQRAPMVWAIGIATIVIVLKLLYVYASNQTLDNQIPLDKVKHIKLIQRRRPIFIVNYEKNDSEVYRAIPLPSARYSYTEQELEKAKRLFKRHGFQIKED